MPDAIRIAALVSGSGTNLQAVIDACSENRIHGRVVCVGSDNPGAAGLQRAARAGIATFAVDYREIARSFKRDPAHAVLPPDFDPLDVAARQHVFPRSMEVSRLRTLLSSRAIAEARLLSSLAQHPFDLLVLAGFMRTLTPYFIDRVNTDPSRPKIMNIHPALLPAFPGTDGYGDTFAYGCKVGGCTVHFVDYGEDSGPIIGQRAFPILPDDTLESVREKGLKLEWSLYPECIQLFAQKRLALSVREHGDDGRGRRTRLVVTVTSASAEPPRSR